MIVEVGDSYNIQKHYKKKGQVLSWPFGYLIK